MIHIDTIEIETTNFVRCKGKSGTPCENYFAIARLDSGLIGVCFSSVHVAGGMHIAKSLEYRYDVLKSGRKVETFVAYLD